VIRLWLSTLCVLAAHSNPILAGPIHFVVAELPGQEVHRDSYVISIDEHDTNRLGHARALVDWVGTGADPQSSPGTMIVVAKVLIGADGLNRNVSAEGEPLWSWHTTQAIEFADFTAEILDGWPTFVEQDVHAWIANTNGAVGFWSYTVVEELASVAEPSSFVLLVGMGTILAMRACRKPRD